MSEQYEAGVKFQSPGTNDMYTAALYDLTQKDVATRDANDIDIDIGSASYVPAGKIANLRQQARKR